MKIVPLAAHLSLIDEIAELHHTEWAHLDRSITLKRRKELLKQASGPTGIPCLYVAISDHQFIGSAAIVEKDLDTHGEIGPWISAVFVRQKWRSQGVASQLLKRCEAEAKKAGAKNLYLSTESSSGLYIKLGWQPLETCEYKGAAIQVMGKTIA